MPGDSQGHRLPFFFARHGFAQESLEFHQVRNRTDDDLPFSSFDDDAVMEIDPGKTFVVLKGPEGKVEKMKIAEPKNLEGLKVGDQVEITYTQALAIEVNPTKKK